MNCLRVGCRMRVLTNDGEFEGTIQSFDVQLGFIALKNVLCLKSQKKFPNIINFMKNEIRKLTILSEPKTKTKRALAGSVQPQVANKTITSAAVKEEPSADGLTDMIQATSRKLSEKNEETKSNASVSVRKRSAVEVPSTEQALLGGIPSQFCEAGNQCFGEDRNDTSDYVLLEEVSDEFYLAISKINSTTAIGVAMEGLNLGRNGQPSWIMISTKQHVFLFDILSFGEDVLKGVFKSVFENENILKVVHDCRSISDLLFHRYGIAFVNIFDTQVASIILYQKSYGRLPKSVDSLVVCLQKNLYLLDEMIYSQKALANSFKCNPSVWTIRPATDNVIQAAAFSVRYLLELRLRLMEKMLVDFVNGVDIYLGVLRDASESHLANLQNLSHMLPKEFQNLQHNSDQSRMRMEELYNREPDDHRATGCLATVDKFTGSSSEAKIQEVHREQMKPHSPEQTCPWKMTNGYESTEESTKDVSGGYAKDKGQNDVKDLDLDESALLTLDDVVKIKSTTAPKSDSFLLVAAGSESTQYDKKQLQEMAKRTAGKLSDFESDDVSASAQHAPRARARSRRVPVFDDVSIIPSSSEPMFYIGRCTTDGFTTFSDDGMISGTNEKFSKMSLVTRDSGRGEPGVGRKCSGGYEDFRVSNRSDGCTSSSSASDDGIQDSFISSTMPSLVPKGRGACVMKLLGLHEPPKPGMKSCPKS